MSLLEVKNLDITFHSVNGNVHAVRGISFSAEKGETLAIVGESGCGKSVTAKAIMNLLGHDGVLISEESEVFYKGKNLLRLREREMNRIRGESIAMVFQDSSMSLNPVMKVGKHITELLRDHVKITQKEARERAVSALRRVDLPDPEEMMDRYPHELSGGQKQRVMIAMAVALNPEILIADEPTTALDVTIQAQILRLLKTIQSEMGMAVILITHDLGIVAGFADRVQVMYGGEILESGNASDIFKRPVHPYTEALLRAVPGRRAKPGEELFAIPGAPPDLRLDWEGCAYAPRCQYGMGICRREKPERVTVQRTTYASGTDGSTLFNDAGEITVCAGRDERAVGKNSDGRAARDAAGGRAVCRGVEDHTVSCWLTDPRAAKRDEHGGAGI